MDLPLDFSYDGEYYNGYTLFMRGEDDEDFILDQIPEEEFPKELN